MDLVEIKYTLYCQPLQTLDHHTYIPLCVCNISILVGIFCSASVGICSDAAKRTFVRSGTYVEQQHLAHNQHTKFFQRTSITLKPGLCADYLSSSTLDTSKHLNSASWSEGGGGSHLVKFY